MTPRIPPRYGVDAPREPVMPMRNCWIKDPPDFPKGLHITSIAALPCYRTYHNVTLYHVTLYHVTLYHVTYHHIVRCHLDMIRHQVKTVSWWV